MEGSSASHPANQEALVKINQHLFYRLFPIFPLLTLIEANEQLDGLDKNSLLIEPFVDDITFISRVVRIFQSIGCWDSNVNLRVTFTDLSQDKIIASPAFYQRAAAMAGWLGDSHDQTMLTRIGDLASEYILLHLTEATGEEPSSREQPSDEKDAKNKKESDDVIDADYEAKE